MSPDVLLLAEARIATVQLLEQLLASVRAQGITSRSRLIDELVPDDITPGTFPLIARSFNREAFELTRVLRRHRVPYAFYIDDNFWLLDTSTELGRHYAQRPERRRLESVVRHASVVIAATPHLRDYLGAFSPNVVQLDSFFDFSLIPELPPEPTRRTTIRAGFAASADRGHDLLPVLADVMGVLEEREELEFEVIGVSRAELPRHPRIRTFPYRSSYPDYVAFQRSREWDFALAPLGAAPSNRYKTDNKFREYAAQGIPGIYQDAPPYASVRDGETGLLAGDTRSWGDALVRYIDDAGLRRRVRLNARRDAELRCSLETVGPRWAQFFSELPPGMTAKRAAAVRRTLATPPSPALRALRRSRLLWAYGRTQVGEHGLLPTVGRTARYLTRGMPR